MSLFILTLLTIKRKKFIKIDYIRDFHEFTVKESGTFLYNSLYLKNLSCVWTNY